MKILLCPDKFKGSLTATQVCEVLSNGILEVYPNAEITSFPMADGGEGSLDVLKDAIDLEINSIQTTDSLGRNISAKVGIFNNKAFIETAEANGLHLLQPEERNPMKTTTTGIGILLSKLIDHGCTEIFLFLGGSSTNDGGTGMAVQLGFQFLDKNDKLIIPKGEDLIKIAKIKTTTDTENLKKIRFTALTDVSHPMHGENGAAFCFARQKGAKPEEIIELDKGLRHLDYLFKRDLNKDIAHIKGTGAAGALGGGCIAFLNAEIKSGLEFIIEATKLEEEIINSDIVITGEGRIDDQSIKGKVLSGIANLCKKHNKKLILVCGESTINVENLSKLYHSAIYSISEKGMSKEQAIREARVRLKKIGKEIMISEVNRAR